MTRSVTQALTGKFQFRLWLAKRTLQRWWRAWNYAQGRLTAPEARDIMFECRPVAGWYSLTTLYVEYTLNAALEEYQDHPALRGYVESACAYVAKKWEPNTEERGAAEDWAIRLVAEYARDDGIVLTPLTAPVGDTDGRTA